MSHDPGGAGRATDALEFVLNGVPTSLGECDPMETLLEWLRARGLTGTKEGCAEGECGACAVAMIHAGPDGRARYQSVNACLLPMGAIVGRELVTVEGIGSRPHLHPVQRALAEGGGSQCGYCTPGFVVSMFAEYYRRDRKTGEFDPRAIEGNLCRCTGYRSILAAARSLDAPATGDPFVTRLDRETSALMEKRCVEGARCREQDSIWFQPTDLREALHRLATTPNAQPIAGGTDLLVERNLRGKRWPALVSLEAVPELKTLAFHADHIEIGAGLTLLELEERLAGRLPLLEQLLPLFSSRPIRARATLGGNLATASPIGDGAPVLLALDASLRLASSRGERRVALDDFFTGYRTTVRKPAELIVSILLPLPLSRLARFYKVSKRELDDISTVAAAFAVELDAAGRVHAARLAYGGVAPTPIRAKAAESALVGRVWDRDAVAATRAPLETAFQPIDDHRGSALYRRAMVVRLFEKFCTETAP